MAEAASGEFQGLRTVIYHAPDLAKARAWYSEALGIEPYFDQPFYVGFNVGGYELGLDPDASSTPGGKAGVVAYWGVADAEAAVRRLISLGATERSSVQEVGEGIRVATVFDPFSNIFGIIENPHFKLNGPEIKSGFRPRF
jgi:predicted enzyme related to lactoylglutathione lyase